MTRKRALILLAIANLALFAVLAALSMEMEDAGGEGMIAYEFAWSEERVEEMKADWGDEGKDAARLSLWVDYPYMAIYGTFLALAALATRDLARDRGWTSLAALGGAAAVAGAGAACFDALENVGLLLALGGHGGDAAPQAAGIIAGVKFAGTAAAILYLLTGLVRRAQQRLRQA